MSEAPMIQTFSQWAHASLNDSHYQDYYTSGLESQFQIVEGDDDLLDDYGDSAHRALQTASAERWGHPAGRERSPDALRAQLVECRGTRGGTTAAA